MATIGQQLLTPETGWRRYDDTDSRIIFSDGWVASTGNVYVYNGTKHQCSNGGTIQFKFKGTKLRIFCLNTVSFGDFNINIDGNIETFSTYAATSKYQILSYEKLGLSDSIHVVTLSTAVANSLDAIDIDDTGYLVYPTLNQVSDINSMKVGDCIPCRYTATTSGVAGYFSELGTCVATEIPITGTATPDGLFYLIKTDKGTLIADRVIQTNISWDALNNAKYIEGYSLQIINRNNNVCMGGTSNAMSQYSTSYSSDKAFDNDTTTQWIGAVSSVNLTRISYKFSTPKTIRSIIFKSPPSQLLKNGKLYGSNDSTDGVNGTWTQLSDCSIATANEKYNLFNFNNDVAYSWVKLSGSLNFGDSACSFYEILMFEQPQLYEMNIGVLRSLSGGVAYADANGNSSLTDKSLGAWPTNNEWDKYIIGSDLKGKITKGDNNIWHWNPIKSWCKETLLLSLGSNAYRNARGKESINKFDSNTSNTVTTTYGFRPVFNYVESDIAASEVIY